MYLYVCIYIYLICGRWSACHLPVSISIPLHTLLAQTSYIVISAFHAMQNYTPVSHRASQNSNHLLQFPLNQNNDLILRSCHVITVITRCQPVMSYQKLFMSSDFYVNTINDEIYLQQSELFKLILFIIIVMLFETWGDLAQSLMIIRRLCREREAWLRTHSEGRVGSNAFKRSLLLLAWNYLFKSE